MNKTSVSRKVISLVLSVLMIVGVMPMAFVATAATAPVYSSGDWIVPEGTWNSNMDGFSNNGAQPAYSTLGIHDTNYVFMQTEDNQAFTYTVNMYVKRNAFANHVKVMSLDTNYNGSADDFVPLITSEYWYCNSSDTVRWVNGSTFPEDVEFNSTTAIPVTYTVEFNAEGSAVYHPEWTMVVRTRSWSGGGYTNYYMDALNYDGNVGNYDPVFTIRVIDLREVNHLIDIAEAEGLTVSDYTGGRDFSGATYYDQATVDEVVAALRQALLCDYSELDAQLARAAAVDPNYEGGLSGYLFDTDLYAAFETAYADAQAVDRFLMSDGTDTNETIIANAASALEAAIDNLMTSRKALITFYDGDTVLGRNVVDTAEGYNLHDSYHKRGNEYYITVPDKTGYEFDGWGDVSGNEIAESTVITGDLSVYALYKVKLNGVAPLSSSGRWDHDMDDDPSSDYYQWGENYVTMWVKDTTFNFVQTQDNQTFSFFTDFTAVKNQGSNYARIDGVYLVNDTETNTFVDLLTDTNGVEVYCVTPQFGNGDEPSSDDNNGDGDPDGLLPGIALNNHASQMSAYFVTWRYIYAFNADGAATYNPKWNIYYSSGGQNLVGGSTFSTQYDLTDGDDTYVNFTINVTDIRELINLINKAESVLNNSNANFTEAERATLRATLNNIEDNYTLDGSVYYEQSEIDYLVAQIKAIIPDDMTIPCDYTELDAAVALAEEKIAEYKNNTNNHFIDEVWTDFTNAYNAAAAIVNDSARPIPILSDNSNQTMIDNATAELLRAINALTYRSHVNEPCEYDPIDNLVDDAINDIGTDNSNGRYDDDAWQDYIDALEAAQDAINQEYYVDSDGNNDNQQIIDDAMQALQDAIDALNNTNNQNDPCDYTMLDALIAQASAINNDAGLITAESYQALQNALSAAQAVDRDLYDNGVNQMIINQAAMNLYNAINGLVPDKTALQNAVDQANAIDQSDYTDESAQTLQDAIDAAQAVLDNDNASVQDVVTALTNLQNAVNSLVPDKTELEETINLAEAIDTTNIDPTVVAQLEDAIADAQAVDNDTDATVQEIKTATETLKQAIDQILQNVVDEANNIDTEGMTPISQTNLEDAIQNAEDVLNNPNATTQEKVDAINTLTDAIDSLTPDKDALEEAITAAESIDTTDLPTDLADALQDAIDAANDVDADPDATVPEIQAATDALNDAIDDILQNAIDEANNTDTIGMDPDTVQDLQDAIDNAEDVLNNPDSTPQEKVDAINAIENAVDALSVDKTALEAAIAAAQSVDTTLLGTQAQTSLNYVISMGQGVDANPDATVMQVLQATAAINSALDTLLDNVIAQAQTVDTTGMSAESIAALEAAITAAQAVDANSAASAQDKADAINNITSAISALTPDKTELEETINLAESIDTTNIEPTVVQQLEDVIDAANDVDADPDATVPEIKAATDALNDVIDQILQNVVDEANNVDTEGMTPVSASNLEDAIADAEAVLNNPDATTQEKVDAINALTDAIDSLTPDKAELEDAITAAESIDTTDLPQELVDALNDAIGDGQDVDNNPDATVPEIKAATDAINDAIDDILQQIIDEAQEILDNPDGYDPQTIQDLQDAVDTANDLLNDPDATAQDKVDAINGIKDAVDNVAVDKQALEDAIIMAQNEANDPKYVQDDNMDNLWDAIADAQAVDADPDATAQEVADAIQALQDAVSRLIVLTTIETNNTADVVVNRDTAYTYMVGLNPAGTTVDGIQAQLINDETTIIITAVDGTTELAASDLVGTGCLVKLVDANDHSVVYEVATVILYGDVNGDGLVNDTDKSLMSADAFFGESNIEAGTVYYIAADLAKDGTLDAFDWFYVDGIATGGRAFDQTQELYKND